MTFDQPSILEHARGMGMMVPVDTIRVELTHDPLRDAPAWVSPAPSSLSARWWEFHRSHPDVYLGLVKLARRATRRGARHLGIAMLYETLRYRTMLGASVPDEDAVKLNNSHRSFYARFLMETCPDLEGVFETRTLRS